MATREAACSCGQLRVELEGDPLRVSVCHCLACQRRTGSAFGIQARWPRGTTRITGKSREYRRISEDGEDEERRFHFCPNCGATVFYYIDVDDDEAALIAIPVGALADPEFPPPTRSVWERRRHAWVTLPDGVQRWD